MPPQYLGFYFTKSVADCSMFNMKLSDVIESLEADEMKMQALRSVVSQREKASR